MINDCSKFNEWFMDVPGVNTRVDDTIPLQYDPATLVSTYDNSSYFPLDGRGFNEMFSGSGGSPHNFLFTSEAHIEFTYRTGQTFDFRGQEA